MVERQTKAGRIGSILRMVLDAWARGTWTVSNTERGDTPRLVRKRGTPRVAKRVGLVAQRGHEAFRQHQAFVAQAKKDHKDGDT